MTARQAGVRARVRPGGTAMKWNLRLAAANRGIWKASELQRMLAERGLVISAGKMSGLWSGDPASIKLSDLDVICAVLGLRRGGAADPRAGQGQQRHQGAGGPGRGRIRIGRTAEGDPAAARRAIASPCLMAGRKASSCADCLAWGVLNGRRCSSCSVWRHEHPGQAGCALLREDPGGQGRLLPDVLAAGPLPVQARRRPPARRGVGPARQRSPALASAVLRPDAAPPPARAGSPAQPARCAGQAPAGTCRRRPSAGSRAGCSRVCRDFTRFDENTGADLANPWLAWALYLAWCRGEARGWRRGRRFAVRRALIILLSRNEPGGTVRYSEVIQVQQAFDVSAGGTAEVLQEMGLLDDDRRPSFEDWLERKLEGLAAGIRADVEAWLRIMRDGGPRSRPRDIASAWNHMLYLRPVLLAWSGRYGHLREVTRDDVAAVLAGMRGSRRANVLVALRSLFGFCKKRKMIFRSPVQGIRVGQHPYGIIQPLSQDEVDQAAKAAATPAARLVLVLAAMHAARPKAIRACPSTTLTSATTGSPSAAGPVRSMTSPAKSWRNGSATGAPAGHPPPTRTC